MDSEEVRYRHDIAINRVRNNSIFPLVSGSDENADALIKQLFGVDFINVEAQPWNHMA